MDSVNRNQQVQTPTTDPSQLDQLNRTDEVSRGYGNDNSVSYRTGGGLVQLPPGASEAPSIPAPDDAITGDVGNLRQQVAQQTSANLRGQVGNLTGVLPSHLFSDQSLDNLSSAHDKLGRLTDASPEVLNNINSSLGQLAEANRNGTLTSGQLDEILMQINASLEDNSVKYAEETIHIDSQQRQEAIQNNISSIREHIEQAEKQQGADSGIMFLKGMAMGAFPPLMLWEAAVDLDRQVRGVENAHISIFTPAEIAHMNPEASPPRYYVPPASSGNDAATRATDPVADATEGMAIAQNGLSHADMMKLLLQMQKQDENNQKLADAVAALEAGDPTLAKQILGDLVDTAGLDASLGESLTTDTSRQNPPPLPESPGNTRPQTTSRDEAQLQPSSETLEPPAPSVNTPQTPQQQADQDLNNFLSQLAPVPEAAADNAATAAQQEGQIQVRNPV
ncbi:hypothetical protein EOPP23_07155 [Endozoicomonas sp. OPT23]|uniref:hypothetical protein n=1 Tax=Endozoicomonas sp. OPT23 TaxID=2072845 RepID=UPI00129B033A|nr:hypothetical protein [Endozoicomonas sp. OPT23]MRI32764.1 hypothetical protein [Endozoicomonas sp. OPT23]